jgi:hypothetical protein
MADSSGIRRNALKDRTPVHREEIFEKIRAERNQTTEEDNRAAGH